MWSKRSYSKRRGVTDPNIDPFDSVLRPTGDPTPGWTSGRDRKTRTEDEVGEGGDGGRGDPKTHDDARKTNKETRCTGGETERRKSKFREPGF